LPLPLPLSLPLSLSLLLLLPLFVAAAVVCFCRHPERSEGPRSPPLTTQLKPFNKAQAIAVALAYPLPPKKNVISTGGGALCRRSGETPVFAVAVAVAVAVVVALALPLPAHLFVIPQGSAFVAVVCFYCPPERSEGTQSHP
jgi:hypothetical protein